MTPGGISDEELVRRALAGEPEAARELYARHAPRLRSLARRRLRGALRRKVGESDLVQDAYRAAFDRLREFEDRGPGSFRRWLERILENKAMDEHKRFARSKRDARREESPSPHDSDLHPAAAGRGPSSLAAMEEEQRRMREAVQEMTGDDRLVLLLVHEQGLGLAEAARLMGRSPEAVRKLYGRVVLRLAERVRRRKGPT